MSIAGQPPGPRTRQEPGRFPDRYLLIALGFILLSCVFVSYHNSFRVPFLLDGRIFIEHDEKIRRIWPLRDVLHGSSRPLTRLSFALNYCVNKLDVLGYHFVNLCVHMAAALALFGLIRRTLRAPRLASRRLPAEWIAFAAALLWAVHPLQTQSVTYIFQRAESFMGLCYVLTVYAAARGFAAGRAAGWLAASCGFCLLGMGSKAIMVTAPVMVLVYDRVFWASSWEEIRLKRAFFYLGLAASWLAVICIALGHHESRASAGFALTHIMWLYMLVQPGVILHYLKISFWPFPLVLDHGWPFVLDCAGILPLAVILAMVLATLWALFRRPTLGFLGFWFFFILMPTSSFFPLADPMEEHRMYLPLAAVIVAAVLAVWFIAGRTVRDPRVRSLLLAVALAAAAVFLITNTVQRNEDYRSRFSMWQDVVSKRPRNPRGHEIIAGIFKERGNFREAFVHYREALLHRAFGHLPEADEACGQYNQGIDLIEQGDTDGAIEHYGYALRLKPGFVEARNNLAVALAAKGRFMEAFVYLMVAGAEQPGSAKIAKNLQDVQQCLSLRQYDGNTPVPSTKAGDRE